MTGCEESSLQEAVIAPWSSLSSSFPTDKISTTPLHLPRMPSSAFPGTYEILVERDTSVRTPSPRSIGVDAVDAMWRVPGVDAVELLKGSEDGAAPSRARLSYLYMGVQRFETIDANLEKFGLRRVRAAQS